MANPKGLSPETARKIRLWLVSFRNTRVILVLAIAVIMAYGTWDMVFTPKFAELQGLSQQLESQQQQVNLVNATEETIKRARKELADFKQIIPDVKMGESPQVVSVSLNKYLLDVLSGRQPRRVGAPLSVPFNTLNVKTVTSMEPKILEVSAVVPEIKAINQSLKLWRFSYEMTADGNYLALVDVLNEILAMDTIVSVDKLELKPFGIPFKANYPVVASAQRQNQPGLPDFKNLLLPHAQDDYSKSVVPLQIVLGVSVFVADPSIQ